jgi:DNA-binding MarR family transcriptional regulator
VTAEQLTLDDAPRYRRTDPMTSRLAAREQTPAKLSAGRWLALDTLARHGPLTDHELAEITGRLQTSIGCRRKDLVRQGWCIATEDRRPSPSGVPSTVWQLTADGLRVWGQLAARYEDGDGT